MTKLKHVTFKGFAFGLRVADSLAIKADVTNTLDVAALHAIKNLVSTTELTHIVHAVGVNNVLYSTEGR